ncbi:MAG TPA: hypothetical protein VF444_21995 [Pseudonocardiaceae bacterium]
MSESGDRLPTTRGCDPHQLRRALVVLLRGAEWSCADAAHDLGADRLADKDLDDLANGLELLASTIRRYRQTRQPETAHNPGRNP